MHRPFRILCTGDLHLGRYPTRIPLDQPSLSVDRVWGDIVSYAIDNRLDAVCLTGDIADHANRFFEALGAIKREVERLIAAEIPTFAVAGNHDYDVLGQLADTLGSDHFRLLGRGGRWEEVVLDLADRPAVRLLGWSFPTNHYPRSPVADFPHLESGPPTLALLHCDLDGTEQAYAPVARGKLLVQRIDAWLLGHQHGPRLVQEGGTSILYPGSPQPLRPPETGPRGPWAVSVDHDGSIGFEHVHLATVQYASIDVDVSSATERLDVDRLVSVTAIEQLGEMLAVQPTLEFATLRVTFTGRTHLHRDMPEIAERLRESVEIPHGQARANVDQISISTTPHHDLVSLASSPGPAGALASLLLDLEAGGDEAAPLLNQASDAVVRLMGQSAYLPLHESQFAPPDRAEVSRMIVDQGLRLLDELLDQPVERS